MIREVFLNRRTLLFSTFKIEFVCHFADAIEQAH